MPGCSAQDLVAAIGRVAEAIENEHVRLTDLDRAIGDGDHGANLNRGFAAVSAKLVAAEPATPGAVLKLVATTLISTVGGASGPLFGTAFLRAATAVGDVPELDSAAVTAALAAALKGVVDRGKAEPGDKTMVDALTPAVAAAAGETPTEVLRSAAAAAEQGAQATTPLVAHKGRASYLGERSAGHLDPGAVSTAVMLRALAGS